MPCASSPRLCCCVARLLPARIARAALSCSALDCAGGARRLRLPAAHADRVDLHRHAAGRGDRARLPQRRHPPARAGADLPAADQDHHRAAAVRNAGRRHRRTLQPAAGRPAGPALHHLLRGRHHHRDLPRTRRDQPQQGRRGRAAARDPQRRHDLGQQAQRGRHHPARLSGEHRQVGCRWRGTAGGGLQPDLRGRRSP